MPLISHRSAAARATRAAVLCVALAAPLPFAAAPAHAATTALFSITDLGAGTGDDSSAAGINNAGVVVGSYQTSAGTIHGFRWTAGTFADLGAEPGGADSWANAINDAGQIAGTADRQGGGYGYPVRWSASGVITDLGGSITNRLGVGNAIDPLGRVAGGQRPADSEGSPIAILYDQAGNQTLLGNPPESLNAATGINARGQVVGGSPAFIWQAGSLTFLPGLPGVGGGQALAINDNGVAVGSVPTPAVAGGTDAAVWQNGALTDLGTIDGIAYSQANAVNAAGQIVGTSDPKCQPCVAPRAWIRQPGGMLTALDTLIPAGSGWTLRSATGINDRGQVVGVGLHNGLTRAFLLTPSFAATVNFARASSTVPAGYSVDSGAVYGVRSGGLSYGWNIDNSANTRDRNDPSSPDQRYDTVIHMERAGSATVWELAVPDGKYAVHIVSGDPDYTDSVYKVTAEGTLVVSGTPTTANHWVEGTAVVTVSDGRLTVTNGTGSSNDKLDYVDVIAAS